MVLSLGCAFVVGLAVTFVVLWATQRLGYIDRSANFMDGIDGLNGGQALCAGGCMGYLLWGLGAVAGPIALILAVAAGGFLVFNFSPVRIFMGDVGSLFIGFVLAACGVLSVKAGFPLWVFSVILAVCFFDVIYMLVRRFLHGENVFEAHRKHLCQRLDKLGWSHRRIDAVAICITLVMGIGGHLYLRDSASVVMFVLGGSVLVFGAVWIETQDLEFA